MWSRGGPLRGVEHALHFIYNVEYGCKSSIRQPPGILHYAPVFSEALRSTFYVPIRHPCL
jgi:hypothetical protein